MQSRNISELQNAHTLPMGIFIQVIVVGRCALEDFVPRRAYKAITKRSTATVDVSRTWL